MTDLPNPDPQIVNKFWERYKPVKSEVWRTIEDFPNYQICEDGRVKNRNNHRELPTSDGKRLVVQLQKDGKQYRRGLRGLYLRAYGRELE